MPTTRYGRYLHFRKRYKRRRARIKSTWRKLEMLGVVTTRRPREWPDPKTMMPRRYPKVVGASPAPVFGLSVVLTHAGGTGVPPSVRITGPLWMVDPPYRPSAPLVRYQHRRVKWWPKLASLPVLAYQGPQPPGPYWRDRWD